MKTLFLVIIIVAYSFVYGSEEIPINHSNNPHCIYFAPEAFYFDLNTHVKEVKVNGKKMFFGFRLGYEYLKPRAFYGSIEIFSAGANKGFNGTYKKRSCKYSGITGFGNLELHLGYNFFPNNTFVVPYIGLGAYSIGLNKNRGFQENLAYFLFGIYTEYPITSRFSFGTNLKGFQASDTSKRFKSKTLNFKECENTWGGEIRALLIWKIFNNGSSIQLQPYFLKLNLSETQNIYGTRLSLNFQF